MTPFQKASAALSAFGLTVVSSSSFAAVSSVIPADLATDQATVISDIGAAGAAVIAITIATMGVRKVIGMFR